jgi:hypothetical protein
VITLNLLIYLWEGGGGDCGGLMVVET